MHTEGVVTPLETVQAASQAELSGTPVSTIGAAVEQNDVVIAVRASIVFAMYFMSEPLGLERTSASTSVRAVAAGVSIDLSDIAATSTASDEANQHGDCEYCFERPKGGVE